MSNINQLAADATAGFREGLKPAGGSYIGMVLGIPMYACALGAAYIHKNNRPPLCLRESWGGAIRRWAMNEYKITEAQCREFSAGFDGYRGPTEAEPDAYWAGRAIRQNTP